jgi:polysaccharide transporter, PST family
MGMIGSVLTTASIVAGLPWGAAGVAAAYSMTGVCITIPSLFWFVCRSGPVRASDVYRTIAPSAVVCILVLGVLIFFRRWTWISSPISGLTAAFVITLTVSLLLFLVIRPARVALADLRLALRPMLQRRIEPK